VDTRALAYLALNQVDKAVRDLENATVVDPSPEKYFHLARAYHMAGRRESANQALKRAKELGLSPEGLHPLERVSYLQLTGNQASR
jgi:tetratricopeptide (TPR) repeat protein